MLKIIFVALFSFSVLGAASDNINLNSSIEPACDINFEAESVASNLDLINSQVDLKVGTLFIQENTTGSSYKSLVEFDLPDHLTHSANPSYIFSFSNLKGVNEVADVFEPLPVNFTGEVGDGFLELYLSYTGVPALSLVQGTYSTTYTATCSVEPII